MIKNTFQIIGSVDIENLNDHLLELERAKRGEQHQSVNNRAVQPLAC